MRVKARRFCSWVLFPPFFFLSFVFLFACLSIPIEKMARPGDPFRVSKQRSIRYARYKACKPRTDIYQGWAPQAKSFEKFSSRAAWKFRNERIQRKVGPASSDDLRPRKVTRTTRGIDSTPFGPRFKKRATERARSFRNIGSLKD